MNFVQSRIYGGKKLLIDEEALQDEAFEWAFQRGREKGTYGIDYEEEDVERWAEDYYNYLKDLNKGEDYEYRTIEAQV